METDVPGAPLELKDLLVRAGAGAGKTTGLVTHVQSIFRDWRKAYDRPPRLVLTTFTRKATQELKERLIRKACADQDADFLRFVSSPADLQITTIHGLLNLFLKQVGHLAGLDAGFRLLNEDEGRDFARLVLRDVLVDEPAHMKWLERLGFEAVLRMARTYAVLEGEQGPLRPATVEDIKAAHLGAVKKWKEQWQELAASILESVDEPKWQEYGLALAHFAETWDGRTDEGLPKKPMKKGEAQLALGDWHDRVQDLRDSFVKVFRQEGWNAERWPAMAADWESFHQLAKAFSARASARKWESGQLELNDLEFISYRLLKETPALGEFFAESIDYWMIDEYQDTSPLQEKILNALIGDKPRYVVGDPQQSIYLFRGSDVGVFARAEERTREAGGEVVEKMTNYRSTASLLSLINDFVRSVESTFKAMAPDPRKSSPGERPDGFFVRAADTQGEVEAVVQRVTELLSAGAPPQSICILARKNDSLRTIAEALRKRGLPTHIHASQGFAERREVLDARALWAFLVNPHDTHNLISLVRSPWFYVPDALITAWMKERPASLWWHLREEKHEVLDRLRAARARVDEVGVIKAFETTLKDAAYIDLALWNDPAGRKESNLWKLIAQARTLEGESRGSLLSLAGPRSFGDPLESSDGDATSAQEPNAISLMTVHGSKGLEFNHVIVPHVGDRSMPPRADVLSALDGVMFFPFPDQDGEGRLESPLDTLLKTSGGDAEAEERSRTLYVAATRAKETLTLTWSAVATSSWASRSSWFALPPGDYQKEGYRFIVRDHGGEDNGYVHRSREIPQVRPLFREDTGSATEKSTVTALVEKNDGRVPLSGISLRRMEARVAGQNLHRRLEALKYGHGEDSADPALQFVLNLQSPPMKTLLETGFVEWGFQVKAGARVVEGQIDLWGIADGKLYVADYKSGSIDRLEKAFEQLTLYAWALRRFGHSEPMELAVIYPHLKRVEKRALGEDSLRLWEGEFGLAEPAR